MKLLKIDDKWSVLFDPDKNDMPVNWLRYGEPRQPWDENNATTAMFYALLEASSRNAISDF